jgi:hypothetical protein
MFPPPMIAIGDRIWLAMIKLPASVESRIVDPAAEIQCSSSE